VPVLERQSPEARSPSARPATARGEDAAQRDARGERRARRGGRSRGGTREGSLARAVGRDALLLGAGSVGAVLAQLAFRGLLVGLLLPAAYGRLALVLGVYNTVWLIGASGLPNAVAHKIAGAPREQDAAIVRAAVRAGRWPTLAAALAVGAVALALLRSPVAFLLGAAGLSSLVYSLLAIGVLRGRGRAAQAACAIPSAGVAEVALLALALALGLAVTPLSAFAVFCAGNAIGLLVAATMAWRTAPARAGRAREGAGERGERAAPASAPSARELLGFSSWLGAAAIGVAAVPLTMRFAAALHSYEAAAAVDVALVLFSVPQRIGSVIVAAVVPHATRALARGERGLGVPGRAQLPLVALFALLAALVAFTPLLGWAARAIGRPAYAGSAPYLALALLAGPARVLYGVAEGVLVARRDGRFLAASSLLVAALASAAILLLAAFAGLVAAFAAFAAACWAVYLWSLWRLSAPRATAGRLLRRGLRPRSTAA
jgi:O-antigen/teichoic acid export membrane protein